jgi:hypothetical protein
MFHFKTVLFSRFLHSVFSKSKVPNFKPTIMYHTVSCALWPLVSNDKFAKFVCIRSKTYCSVRVLFYAVDVMPPSRKSGSYMCKKSAKRDKAKSSARYFYLTCCKIDIFFLLWKKFTIKRTYCNNSFKGPHQAASFKSLTSPPPRLPPPPLGKTVLLPPRLGTTPPLPHPGRGRMACANPPWYMLRPVCMCTGSSLCGGGGRKL